MPAKGRTSARSTTSAKKPSKLPSVVSKSRVTSSKTINRGGKGKGGGGARGRAGAISRTPVRAGKTITSVKKLAAEKLRRKRQQHEKDVLVLERLGSDDPIFLPTRREDDIQRRLAYEKRRRDSSKGNYKEREENMDALEYTEIVPHGAVPIKHVRERLIVPYDAEKYPHLVNPLSGEGGQGLLYRNGITRKTGGMMRAAVDLSREFLFELAIKLVAARGVGRKSTINSNHVRRVALNMGFDLVFPSFSNDGKGGGKKEDKQTKEDK
jgi:hypothetical protein